MLGLLIEEVVTFLKKAGLPAERAPVFLDTVDFQADPKLHVRKWIAAIKQYIAAH